jgi:nucleoside-diphosphate-sugar epimerase
MMNVLLTGATGYIGSRLATECIRLGDDTHVIVRQGSDRRRLPEALGPNDVHLYDGSLESLVRALQASKPDVVVHLASLFTVQHKQEQVVPLFESNILFGALLLEAMVASGVEGFVNAGSFWQHFDSEDYNPANLYAATKKAFNDILKYYVEATALRAITLELPDTFGPDDPRRKVTNLIIDHLQRNTPLELTAGDQVLDLVHVDDVVNAFVSAMRKVMHMETKSAAYALSSGCPMKLKDLVGLAESISGKNSCLKLGAKEYRFREVMTTWEGGKPMPNWHPSRTIESFLSEQLRGRSSESSLRDN